MGKQARALDSVRTLPSTSGDSELMDLALSLAERSHLLLCIVEASYF